MGELCEKGMVEEAGIGLAVKIDMRALDVIAPVSEGC